jgi:hypothetical protein
MKYLLLALKYLPVILNAVTTVEAIIGSGNGKTKMGLVLSCVDAVSHIGEKVDVAEVQMVSGLAESVVGVLNGTGYFSHGEPATPTAQAQVQ